MTISEKITNLRKEKNLSQEAFAEALGVSRQSVSKWESGSALPDTDKIIAMSELFGVSTDYLLKNDAVTAEPVTYNPPENQPVETEKTERNDDMSPKKKKSKKGRIFKIVALILALIILATVIGIPSYFGSFREAWWELNGGKVKYPYVLVHGLGGWGEGDGVNDTVQYWGATSMNLVEYLNEQGYEVHAPSVGPVSSTWDRACELYAQLTGTRVDYGEAHAKAHNHERFGREYTEPLVAQWGEKINGGQRIKINLVGHSFGGATVRLLSSLLEYGSDEEKAATEGEISPLFEGGKGDWVYSVTALCAPHNGSSLTEVLDSVGGLVGIKDTTDMLTSLCFGVAGLTANTDGIYDFKLEHFGINNTDFDSAVEALTASGNDHAVYDLTPDGAAKLNETMINGIRQIGTTSAEQVESLNESPMASIRMIQKNLKNFIVDVGTKIVKLIQEFYTEDRYIEISTGLTVDNIAVKYAKLGMNTTTGEQTIALYDEAMKLAQEMNILPSMEKNRLANLFVKLSVLIWRRLKKLLRNTLIALTSMQVRYTSLTKSSNISFVMV